MTAATFGDFLEQADAQLEAAAACSHGPAGDPAAVAGTLARVVAAMARYLDDRVPAYAAGAITQADLQPWEHAVAGAGMALHHAALCLERATAAGHGHGRGSQGELGDHLAGAAASLVAGRDLLHTHLTADADGVQQHRSQWAAVVASLPVTRALTGEIARRARPLALLAARLASAESYPAGHLTVLEGLEGATGWLWRADAVVLPARAADPVTGDDLTVLPAIPALRAGRRRPPVDSESIAELHAGITLSAERLRTVAFTTTGQGRSADTTADTWRWTARAAAVAGHTTELVLRSLSSHPGRLSELATEAARLPAAADAVAQAWRAWRQVSAAWMDLTTETQGHRSAVETDMGDLVLRLGRLAWDDPQWTPTSGRTARPRAAADLVGGDAVGVLLAAMHQAADAFAQVAAADLAAVRAADRADRLYIPTRSLPSTFDVPRRYAIAPRDLTRPLLDAYHTAVQVATQATGELATLALAAGAPSGALALARAAAADNIHSPDQSRLPMAPVTPASSRAVWIPGPTELKIRELRVTDPALLLRAAAIDNAARRLVSQAERTAAPPARRGRGGSSQRRPPRRPARLAAKDTPHRPMAARGTARTTSSQSGRTTAANQAAGPRLADRRRGS
jgi:hypothetical protein